MTYKNYIQLLGYLVVIACVSSCGVLSTAAPDALAAIEVADKLNAAIPETPEVPEVPQIPDAPALSEAQQVPEIPEMPETSGQLESPDSPVPAQMSRSSREPRIIGINLHAANYLNVDASGRSLALITKIYKLKQYAAFQQAPYDTFLDSQKEKDVLGADLVEVKETTLIPGQRYHAEENFPRQAEFIGIVGLFRAPAKGHWRATFPAKQAEKTGITVGMLGCSLTLGTGLTIDADNQDTSSYVRCQQEDVNTPSQINTPNN